MTWDGKERRSGQDRRQGERRRTVRYNVANLLIIDGITWIDSEESPRRHFIRRREDREMLAEKILKISQP